MQIGKQIYILRKQKKLSRATLAAGICSPQALANIEDGISIPDKLLVDVLIQRLGKSPDRLEMILTAETYHMEKMRELYEELLQRGNEEKAEYLLEKYRAKYPQNDALQQMYYCRSKAYLEYRLRENPVNALEWLKQALDISLPGWEDNSLCKYRISTIEMENLLAYGRMCLEQCNMEQEASDMCPEQILAFLEQCADYIQKYVTDEEEHAKIFSKCAWLLARCYLHLEEFEHAIELCRKAFGELQEYGISYFMLPLLNIMVEQGEDILLVKKYREYGNYRRILNELLEEYDEDWRFKDSLFRNCSQKMYHLDYEYIRGERLAQGYTQEELIESVYEAPESLSRVETGKVSPTGKKFAKMMGKLHVEKSRYNGFVITESFDILEQQQQVAALMGLREYAKAEQLLDHLEEKLDLSEETNIRVVQYYRNAIAKQKEGVDLEKILQSNMELLQQTYHVEGTKTYRAPDWLEAYLINQIAILYEQTGQRQDALATYLLGIRAIEESNVAVRHQYRAYALLVGNYAAETCSEEYAKRGIKNELSNGKLMGVGINHMTLICVLLKQADNRELCKKLLKDNYYLHQLALIEKELDVVKSFYEQHIEEPFVL